MNFIYSFIIFEAGAFVVFHRRTDECRRAGQEITI